MIPFRTRAFWTAYRVIERRPAMQQPADKVRAASDLRNRLLRLPGASLLTGGLAPGITITDTVDGAGRPLRVYRPEGTSGALPVVLNFHGGGWVSGDIRQSEWWASSVAARAGVTVVSVGYRLAPEHPYPVPAEDCYAATAWVAEYADELDVDASRLAVMGDSAGGNLATVVALMARDRGGPAIAFQVLIYPGVDMDGEWPSEQENAHAPILQAADIENVKRLYLSGAATDRSDPYVSPLHATLDDLPPALVQTAQFDPLRDQGRAYADALAAAGVPVRYTNYVGAVHGYISLPRVIPAAAQALEEVVSLLDSSVASTWSRPTAPPARVRTVTTPVRNSPTQ